MQVYQTKTITKHVYLEIHSFPGSKSISNRVIITSSLSDSPTTLYNFLESEDTNVMLDAIQKFGTCITKEKKDTVIVYPPEDLEKVLPTGDIFVANSGTTARFITAYSNIFKSKVKIYGTQRMHERPIKPLIDALKSLGANIKYLEKEGFLPVLIESEGLKSFQGGEVEIDGSISSQYISALLLIAPVLPKGLIINIKNTLVSKPFVKMTLKILEQFGAIWESDENFRTIKIKPTSYLSPSKYYVEPDATNLMYFLSIPAIVPGKVKAFNITKNSIQGDIKFLEVLERIGCKVRYGNNFVEVEGTGEPRAIEIDMNELPDLVQTLAVISLFADGKTKIYNIANLKYKETDRLVALKNELEKIGAEVIIGDDFIEITPRPERYKGTEIETYNDHRMAMSFTLAGLRIEGITIKNPSCVEKTFPDFFKYWEKIYA